MIRSRAVARRAAGVAIALLVLLVACWLGPAFGGHDACSPTCTNDHPATPVDPAALRAEIERIHGGKVDPATLKRIEADLLDLHRGVPTAVSHAPGRDGPLSTQIAQYLTARPDRAESASWQRASWTEVAQTTPVAAPPADAAKAAGPAKPHPEPRTYVGQETCEACHQQESTNWAHTIHAKIFDLHPRNATEAQGCEACHGPGSDHVQNPADLTTIISFSAKSQNPVADQNTQCLTCHKGGQRIFWHDSIHESNNVGCSDCHNPMTTFGSHGLTARESINQTCFQCHKQQHAEFGERSHMPLLEGKITCVDCHNPHGSTTAPLLKADSVNELCYSCHAEKRGPFLFEHAPVRESCLNCHAPHGSNFENLLTTPRPVLCQQCHSQDGHPAQLLTMGNLPKGAMPDPRLVATSCSTCHVNIHGSNDPSGSRFER